MAYSTLIHTSSPSLLSLSKTSIFNRNITFSSSTSVPHLGLSWNGLRSNGFSVSLKFIKKFEKKRKSGGKGVFASLFGVGAPEALVVGVVALLVFGPKGLAEIAKNLGKTLRTFQPTIRELQEVSREFKSTLEQEIGLDGLKNPSQLSKATVPTLSSTPLSVATPEKSPEIKVENAAAATAEDSQETLTPLIASNENSQENATPLAPANEDSWATAAPLAATTGDDRALATIPATTSTIDSSSIPEVAVGSEVGTVV